MSTDRQEDSIDRQRDQVTRYAATRGYRLVAEYKDEGIAGDVFDRRPDFQKMLQAAQRQEFDVIVVDEPSRLSRQNPIELIEKVIAPLRRSGIKIDTASKGLLDYESLAGLILLAVHAHKSEDESRDLSRRSLGGIARRALAGTYFGWMAPYGLRIERDVDPVTAKVTARRCTFGPEEEVRTVRFLFDAVANRGWSLRRLCRELEDRGVKPPVGNGRGSNKREGRWNPGTLRKMLTNRKYVGDLPWNETHQGKYSRWLGAKNGEEARIEQAPVLNRRSSRNDPADVIVCPDAIPALIDRATFARAGAALALATKHTSPHVGPGGYLFTHLLVCGDCGSFLRGQPFRGEKVYLCAKYKEYGGRGCSRNAVLEQRLWQAILGVLQDEILSPERLNAIETEMVRQLEAERSSGEADRLRRQVDALDRDVERGNANLARLPEDRLPGVIAQVRAWEGERAGLLARLHDLENGADESKKILAEARKQLGRLRDALEAGDLEAQATVVREVVSKIEVRFAHEKTSGRRSPTGQGRKLSKPTGAVLYVRPGLGLSCLATSDLRNPAHAGASRRASSCLPLRRGLEQGRGLHRGNCATTTGPPGRQRRPRGQVSVPPSRRPGPSVRGEDVRPHRVGRGRAD
jgi:DNA invertase Pin-like site-specific DNA recombinase